MKKSDLKPGMVVEYANGDRRLVIEFNNKLFLLSNDKWGDLGYYTLDLKCPGTGDFDINKIYQPQFMTGFDSMLKDVYDCIYDCIWERPKPVELTMKEIAEKFGINVEQLKIKK